MNRLSSGLNGGRQVSNKLRALLIFVSAGLFLHAMWIGWHFVMLFIHQAIIISEPRQWLVVAETGLVLLWAIAGLVSFIYLVRGRYVF